MNLKEGGEDLEKFTDIIKYLMNLEKLLHLNNIPTEEIYYDMGV